MVIYTLTDRIATDRHVKCVFRELNALREYRLTGPGQATGRSRNATDASEPDHPASGRPRPQGFAMAPAQVHATTLQMISPGYPSAVVSDFHAVSSRPSPRDIYSNCIMTSCRSLGLPVPAADPFHSGLQVCRRDGRHSPTLLGGLGLPCILTRGLGETPERGLC